MDEMDIIALDVEDKFVESEEVKLEVVGTSKGIFQNQKIAFKLEKATS